ncbi:lytic transglycosylase domain-containing protein, partial [Halomonas sp. BBD48]|nr:lytic transglycosylase domain-containing protein [Halomonas sp. BBD48]
MRGAIMAMAMLGGLLMASQANAGSPDIPTAYVVAAEDNGVPPEVLYAVASAESKVSLNAGIRPWPWTLNIAGESMRFGDRNSACEALL